MRYRLLTVFIVLSILTTGTPCLAQSEVPKMEIEGFYQRIQGFDYRTGIAGFDIRDAHLNGGGFGFDYNLNRWFGLWGQMGFYGSVQQGGINPRLINELQG